MLIKLDRHECFSNFHLQKDKQRKQRHSLKLGKKRRESSKRNYYIISLRVIIKAIIIIYAGNPINLRSLAATEGTWGGDFAPAYPWRSVTFSINDRSSSYMKRAAKLLDYLL